MTQAVAKAIVASKRCESLRRWHSFSSRQQPRKPKLEEAASRAGICLRQMQEETLLLWRSSARDCINVRWAYVHRKSTLVRCIFYTWQRLGQLHQLATRVRVQTTSRCLLSWFLESKASQLQRTVQHDVQC